MRHEAKAASGQSSRNSHEMHNCFSQKFFVDDRFITSIESDQQECWFPMQVLNTVQNAPNMQEDVQVEIMKV